MSKWTLTKYQVELPPGDQMFECYHCWYKTKNKLSLEDHMRTHLVDKPYVCDVCNFKASQKNYLLQHKKAHLVFGCSLCDFKSYEKMRVKEHLARAHRTPNLEKLYRCEICCYETTDVSYLTKHMSKHVASSYKCDMCDYTTRTKVSLMSHIPTAHPGVKPFTCDECDFKTTRQQNLRKHKNRHRAEKPFSCDVCGFGAITKSSLEAHKRIHGDRPYTCTACDYKSYLKFNVTDHMKIHSGEKPLTCEYCPYSTRKKSDLKRHMKVHSTKKKPYKCNYCNHRTNERYTLESHMRATHTGDHPFKCSVCNKSYYRKSALSEHVKKRHADMEEGSYKCLLCEYIAKRPVEITNHILDNHTGRRPIFDPDDLFVETVQELVSPAPENACEAKRPVEFTNLILDSHTGPGPIFENQEHPPHPDDILVETVHMSVPPAPENACEAKRPVEFTNLILDSHTGPGPIFENQEHPPHPDDILVETVHMSVPPAPENACEAKRPVEFTNLILDSHTGPGPIFENQEHPPHPDDILVETVHMSVPPALENACEAKRPVEITNHILDSHTGPGPIFENQEHPPHPEDIFVETVHMSVPPAPENACETENILISHTMTETTDGGILVTTKTTDGNILVTTENSELQTFLSADGYENQFEATGD